MLPRANSKRQSSDCPLTVLICGRGEIGRRAGFRFLWETMGVQVPSSAPRKQRVGFMSALCLRYPALRRDLRVEAFAGANGLRAITLMNNKAWRKLNSPVGCSPGRAAKGASPFVRTTSPQGAFRNSLRNLKLFPFSPASPFPTKLAARLLREPCLFALFRLMN